MNDMFDFLRNLTKSAADKRQEAAAAYLDGALGASESRRFEQEMAQDAALRTEVEQLRLVKQSLNRLPQRRVPRNFLLDPAKYRRPAPQPWVTAYPVLRTATALAAFFFIFAVVAGTFTGFGALGAPAPAADVALVEEVEMTRVTTEQVESLAVEAEAVEEAPAEFEVESAADAAAPAMDAETEALEEAGEVVVEEQAEPLPAAEEAAAEDTADAILDDTAEEETAAQPQGTAVPAATPTVSALPRLTPTPPLANREFDVAEAEDGEGGAAAAGQAVSADESADKATVEPTETIDLNADRELLAAPLPWVQIGLGLLFIVLSGLTFYARRQR